MNDAQRSVIQRHYRQLADDIIITEELLASLYQHKVFERGMLETIKAERTPTEQTVKLLSLLPRRGPEAFEVFVSVIQEDYPWLATTLTTSYRTVLDTLARQESFSTICTCGGQQRAEPQEVKPVVEVDPDIKTRVGMFIHKHFGQSKRISQTDKKTMEKWMSEQVQQERKRMRKLMASTSEDNSTEASEPIEQCRSPSPLTPDPQQEELRKVYNKVRDENLSDTINSSQGKNTSEQQHDKESGLDEVDAMSDSPKPLEPVSIANLDSEVNTLINRLNHLETLVNQCHYILGDHEKEHKLPTLVKDAQIMSKHYERELKKEKEKSEKMLTELYDYVKSINKLENNRKQQRMQVKTMEESIESLKRENAALTERCTTLEAANMQHIEKEKTLENLRKMVNDLKNNRNSQADENANYRSPYGGPQGRTFRRTTKVPNRRGSLVDTGVINSVNVVRKTQKTQMNVTKRKPPGRFP